MDDGPFRRGDRTAPLVAVAVRLPGRLEAVDRTVVRVDGTDATARIIGLLRREGRLRGAHAIVLDGVTVGGFNLVDLDAVRRACGRAVIAVTRRPPDFPAIHRALRKYFPEDYRHRWALARAHRLFRVPTPGRPLRAAASGCTAAEAAALLARTRLGGYWPEPLRLAHLVAQALARRPAQAERLSPRGR